MSTSSHTPLFVDVETEPLEHCTPYPRPVVATLAWGDEEPWLADPDTARLAVVGAPGAVVGHNVAYDFGVLGLEPRAGTYDTAVRAVLQGAAEGDPAAQDSSLARLARRLGLELGGKGTTQLSFRAGIPLSREQELYAKGDVVATRAVWKAQGSEARRTDEERQTQLSHAVFKMARAGVHIDTARLRAEIKSLGEQRTHLRDELKETGLIEARGPKKDPWRSEAVSTAKVQARLLQAGVKERTEGGLLASDEATLRHTRDPVLARLAQMRALDKMRSLYESFDVGEVVRARWKTLVATGRVACAEPNLTNIPRVGGLRECIVPSAGSVLIAADYPALEMRTWAQVCYSWLGHSTLLKLWEEGRDPHWQTAAAILRVTYAEALAHPQGRQVRQVAKALNFGLPGGMGVERLRSHLLEKTGSDPGRWGSERLRAAWFKAYPEAEDYFAYIRQHDYITALPWSRRVRKALYSEACNYPFQGTGSDVAKEALHLCQAAGLSVVALIHDELLIEVETSLASQASHQLVECMMAAGRLVCPDVPWDGISVEVYPERWASK